MSLKFNPLTGFFDIAGSGSSTIAIGDAVTGSTPNSILEIDGSGNLGEIGPLTDGQLIIGSTGLGAVAASLTGTSNRISVTNGAGSITLSTPQDIHSGASPTFTGLTLSSLIADRALISNGSSAISVSSVTSTELGYVSGVTSSIQTQLNNKISNTEKGAANGVATLDGGGKVPVTQLPSAVMTYEGVWNASTNSPTLADGVGDAGMVYRVGTAGTQDLGSGSITFNVSDYIIYNGTIWEKSDTTDAVASVNGFTGIVILDTDDVSEGVTNLYFTNTRAQTAITGGASSIVTTNLTIDRALISDGLGKVAVSSVTSTELGYVSGVTSSIQTQFNNRANTTLSNLTNPTSINQNLFLDELSADTISSKDKTGTDTSGSIIFKSGDVEDGNAGDVTIVGGAANLDGNGGNVYIDGGAANGAGLVGQLHLGGLNGNSVVLDATMVPGGGVSLGDSSLPFIDIAANNLIISDISNSITITYPTGGITSSFTLKLPDGVGSSGQFLTTDGSGNLSWTNSGATGDIQLTSFSGANNQAVAADVTGFSFNNASVRSFKALVSVHVDATSPLFEVIDIQAVQKGSSWEYTTSSTGDVSNVLFTITNAGQVQYTSDNYAGFTSLTIKFRAIVTNV